MALPNTANYVFGVFSVSGINSEISKCGNTFDS